MHKAGGIERPTADGHSGAAAPAAVGPSWLVWLRPGTGGFPCAADAGLDRAQQSVAVGRCLFALPTDTIASSWYRQGGRVALFYGYLLNREDLKKRLEIPPAPASSDAEILLAAWESWGADAAPELEGSYAAIVWDEAKDTLLCIRDPIGVMPLFYASVGGALVLSSDIWMVLDHPDVPREVSRLVMAEHLLWRHTQASETFFARVRRLPGAHRLLSRGRDIQIDRYWDPVPPPGQSVEWLDSEEQDRFPEVMQSQIAAYMALGPSAVSLSGGLDSVSVAAVAARVAEAHGWPRPHALAVHFDTPAWDESAIQTGVAQALAMPLRLISAEGCLGGRPLLHAAAELSPSYPSPLYSLWEPINLFMSQVAQSEGIQVLLTGIGGDEWLSVTPRLAADLIRAGDVVGLWRLYRAHVRSFQLSPLRAARSLFWRHGLQEVLRDAAWRHFPGQMTRRRRPVELLDWIAPDPELRRELAERFQPPESQTLVDSSYVRDMRPMLQRPLVAMGMELLYYENRRRGLFAFHPYWSRPIAEFTLRTPPQRLNDGGRSKGLVRRMLAEQFPKLGFERQKKLTDNPFFERVVTQQWQEHWRRWAPDSALARAGVVDLPRLRASLERKAATGNTDYFPVWLLAEAWLRGQR